MLNLSPNAHDLGHADELEVLTRLVSVQGLKLLDVGCGDGRVARKLAALGAEVIGIEPDPVQSKRNLEAAPVPHLSFIEAPGEALPMPDNSIDGVIFTLSFHHVPEKQMDRALLEAARVLKPATGFLYILEPMMEGTLEEIYKPFHDETQVRTLAYEALKRTAEPNFETSQEFHYQESISYDGFETFVAKIVGANYNDILQEAVDNPEVRALFESGQSGESYIFSAHSRVNLYRAPN